LNKWIISITAGPQQEPSILECKKIGLKIVTIDENPNAVGHQIADLNIIIKLDLLTEIISILDDNSIVPNAVFSFVSDAGALCAAKLRAHYNIPGIGEKDQGILLNKALLKKNLNLIEARQPKFFTSSEKIIIKDHIKSFNQSCILKPVVGSGSRGVNLVNSDSDVEQLINDCFAYSDGNGIIIEEYIKGSEYSIETFCDNQKVAFLAFSKRKVNIYNSATEIFSVILHQNLLKSIKNEILKVYNLFNYPNGPGHFELIVNEFEQCYLIDIAFRGGGFMIYNHLVEKVSGFNIIKNTILQSLGEKIIIDDNYDLNKYIIIKFIQGKDGVVKSISGFNKINQLEGITAFPYVNVGDFVTESASDSGRLGVVIVEGNNYKKANKRAKILAESVTIIIS
tara:strand:+ start:3180 stop:4367 length:1188 start_codon:yes stop_codon:yes gene_type:complete